MTPTTSSAGPIGTSEHVQEQEHEFPQRKRRRVEDGTAPREDGSLAVQNLEGALATPVGFQSISADHVRMVAGYLPFHDTHRLSLANKETHTAIGLKPADRLVEQLCGRFPWPANLTPQEFVGRFPLRYVLELQVKDLSCPIARGVLLRHGILVDNFVAARRLAEHRGWHLTTEDMQHLCSGPANLFNVLRLGVMPNGFPIAMHDEVRALLTGDRVNYFSSASDRNFAAHIDQGEVRIYHRGPNPERTAVLVNEELLHPNLAAVSRLTVNSMPESYHLLGVDGILTQSVCTGVGVTFISAPFGRTRVARLVHDVFETEDGRVMKFDWNRREGARWELPANPSVVSAHGGAPMVFSDRTWLLPEGVAPIAGITPDDTWLDAVFSGGLRRYVAVGQRRVAPFDGVMICNGHVVSDPRIDPLQVKSVAAVKPLGDFLISMCDGVQFELTLDLSLSQRPAQASAPLQEEHWYPAALASISQPGAH